MATATQNNQIGNIIIKTVIVLMMHIHVFFCFFAESTVIWKFRKSNLSISSLSMFKLTVFNCSWLRFITTDNRTEFFFKVFCSRFWKTKILSTTLTLSCKLRLKLNSFISAFRRATNCFAFRKAQNRDRKFIATNTSQFDLFFLKFSAAIKRTKEIFISFCLPQLCFKMFITKRAVDFHIQHDNTQEVLC